jgi:uncharacterized secreted repeat protein (TIGR03808 family)
MAHDRPNRHDKTMRSLTNLSRRAALAGFGAALCARPLGSYAKGVPQFGAALDGATFGLVPDAAGDQTAKLQAALQAAARAGRPLFLAGGRYIVGGVELPAGTDLAGVAGATVLQGAGSRPILSAEGAANVSLAGLTLDGMGSSGSDGGVLACRDCHALSVENLAIARGASHGFLLESCAGAVTGTTLTAHAQAGIFANNNRGLILVRNSVGQCGNGGILVWRDSPGADGTIVTQNRVTEIFARGGGSGQNGNGINIFRADGVTVSDNVIGDCDFSAIRANTTRDAIIRGNQIGNCREVAIYSEFAFSGSEISGNVIDGAAAGISITNSKEGGRLAVCANNIVRNIFDHSSTNPDVTPYGIGAEADAIITGNVVDHVPGPGITAGWGPYLRNVLITDNIVSNAATGIAVSVATGAGAVRVTDNMISGAMVAALAGMAWDRVASADLAADAGRFPNVSLSGNVVAP